MFRSATLAERVTGHVLAGPHKGKSVVIELWILHRSTLTVIKLDSKHYAWLGEDLSYFNEAVSLIKPTQGGTMSLNEK